MKKIITALCAFALLANSFGVFAQEERGFSENSKIIEIHVSPKGEDANEGTEEKPLKTLEGAKTRVKAVKDRNTQVKVIFHDGEYRINKTVSFKGEDSGFDENPVIFAAAEGEKPVFKGSVLLDATKFTDIEDKSVYNILPEKSAPEIAQLNLKAQGITSIGDLPCVNYGANVVSYNGLYLDDEEQTLSRWPNTGYSIMGKTVDAKTAVFEVNESNAARWGHSPNMRYFGFTSWDWAYERTKIEWVDTETRQIKLYTAPLFSKSITITNGRYCIVNILEELDEPGEWYIDKEKMILYYYPIYPVTNAKLELSVLSETMLLLDGVSNVVFDGLSFEQTMNHAICMKNTNNITFTNCSFKNIGRNAISNYESSSYTDCMLNGNIEISNSEFYNIGASGIELEGGNEDTLEMADIFIINNHFSRCGQLKRSYAGAIRISGVGFTIEHNVIEDMPHMGIGCNGSLHQINYNEIFNVCQDSNDMGAIYSGRNLTWRGVEVKYNYIHDIVPEDGLAGQVMGVYWDDNQGGNIMKYNIFENIPRGIMLNNGGDHIIEDNIFVNCPQALCAGYVVEPHRWTTNAYLFEEAIAKAEAFPVYYETFPEMKFLDPTYTVGHGNRFIHNYAVDSGGNAIEKPDDGWWDGDLTKHNLSENNIVKVNEYTEFVDPDNGNYELKPDSYVLNTLPELGKIKMSEIGRLEKKDDKETEEFHKLYPKNGQDNISTAGFYFKWQPSHYYTTYHVVAAEDPEFKNVVFEKNTIRNYVFCDKLQSGGKVYYWNVTGIAGGITSGYTQKSATGSAFSFKTANRELLDQVILGETIASAERLYSTLTPGTNLGQCDQKNITWYKEVIDGAKVTNKLKFGNQDDIDAKTTELEAATSKMMSYIYKGYASIDSMLADSKNWNIIGDASIENNVLSLGTSSHAMYNEYVKTFNIYKFKVKIENFNHMFVIAYKTQVPGNPWAIGSINYSFYLKNNIFEFQRYMGGTGGIIETKPNDGLLKEGEWAEIAVGAMDVPGGIQVYVTINDQEIFNYFDDTGAITKDGYMQFSTYGPVTAQVMAVDDLGKFDQSIVKGGEVEYKEPVEFDNALLTSDNIKGTNGAVTDINGEILLKGTKENNVFALNKPVEANMIYSFDAMLNTAEKGQSIAILGADSDNEYRINFTQNGVELVRYFDGNSQVLFIGKKQYIKDNQYSNFRLGSCSNKYGTRVFLYVDGQKVFDTTDMYNRIKIGGLKFYDNNLKGLIIR